MVLPTASWLLLCVALQICRVLSCKISHAVPPIIPADSAGAVRVIIVGHGFSTDRSGATLLPNVNITCHGRGGLSGSEFIQRDSQARLLNDTAVECYLNPVPVHLAAFVDLKLNGNEAWSEQTNASLLFQPLVDVTPGMRPYLSSQPAELLIAPNMAAIEGFPGTVGSTAIKVCRYFNSTAGKANDAESTVCTTHALKEQRTGTAAAANTFPPSSVVAVPLGLGKPASTDEDLVTVITFLPTGFTSAKKKSRFLTIPTASVAASHATAAGSYTQVDHKRRMLRVNGNLFLSVGFYVHSITEVARKEVSMQQALEDLVGLAAQGINHVQVYSMEALEPNDLSLVVSTCESHGLYFGFSLVSEVVAILNKTSGGNTTKKWEALFAKAEQVRSSPSLLGWYVCDDCDDAIFDKVGLATIYTALKAWDPAHVLFGADWTAPWTGWAWGEASDTGLGFDVPQVENYILSQTAMQKWDGLNRNGMRFEVLINSPPMYLLDPLINLTASTPGHKVCAGSQGQCVSYPPISEATQGWLSAILYDAPGQLNFIWESRAINVTGSYPWMGHSWSHADALGQYGETATKLATSGVLLPDLTLSDTHIGTVAADGNVVAKGLLRSKTLGDGTFCAYLIVANLGENPTSYTLFIGGGGDGGGGGSISVVVPDAVTYAGHIFVDSYNVTVKHLANGSAVITDMLTGYGSAVLQLGACS